MRREWKPEDLIASWTLIEPDWELIGSKPGATRLGFAALLKFFEIDGRFPEYGAEVPDQAVTYLAEQVEVDPALFAKYQWSGRTSERHRAQVRAAMGFRECTEADQQELSVWLSREVCPTEWRREALRDVVLVHCRSEQVRLEPPTFGQISRLVGSALRMFEERFCRCVEQRLDVVDGVVVRLEQLVGAGEDPDASAGGGERFLYELKTDPGVVGTETFRREVAKLERVKALGLPTDLFDGWTEKLVIAWRDRAARCFPSDLAESPRQVRLTLLAALCHARTTEITDSLVELLIQLVLKIDTRAERRVEKELTDDLKRVTGKTWILYRVAEAAVAHPDETVRQAIYPVAGEATLRELAKEAKAERAVFNSKVRTVLRGSYSHHYRRLLPDLLAALEFRANNTIHRPVMDAVELLGRYTDIPVSDRPHYSRADRVPLEGVVPREWRDAVLDDTGRVERIPYELCVLKALREAIRRREIWVVGANRWRNHVSISAIEQACEEKIRALKRLIEQARTAAQAEVEHIRARQAMAVWQISDAGRTVGQIVELLELPEKEARRLVRVGRPTTNTNTNTVAGGDRNGALSDGQEPPSEQRDLSGIAAQQNSSEKILVPAIADSVRKPT